MAIAVCRTTVGLVGVMMPLLVAGAQSSPPVSRDTNDTARLARATAQPDSARKPVVSETSRAVEVSGRVVGLKGFQEAGILVFLTARSATGDTIWSAATTTARAADSSHAEFRFVYPNPAKLGAARLELGLVRQKVSSVPDHWYSHGKWVRREHIVISSGVIDSAGGGVVRRDIALELDPAPPFYTFLLFAPALIGLIAATTALIVFERKGGHGDESNAATKKAKGALLGYTVAGTIAWVGVVGWFAGGFVTSGLRKISLFDPDLSIPVILPVAAFIGVLVYATECLVGVVRKKDPGSDDDTIHKFVDYQQTLIELGNRVFIAPYVAIIAVLTIFRGTTDGLAVPFVAFFTGLWIEPVLRLLRMAGEKLLPSGRSNGNQLAPREQKADDATETTPAVTVKTQGNGKHDEAPIKPTEANAEVAVKDAAAATPAKR